METRVITRIECETEKIRFRYWDPGREEWIELHCDSNLDEASDKLHCSVELLKALIQTMGFITDQVSNDLCSIWRRLDAIEEARPRKLFRVYSEPPLTT